ncbi:MAG: PBP1A family penicillin-binding protein [Clostridia bacterium]|nr:PBP1A family penicillin-binding protein [Clostridia bacterium]
MAEDRYDFDPQGTRPYQPQMNQADYPDYPQQPAGDSWQGEPASMADPYGYHQQGGWADEGYDEYGGYEEGYDDGYDMPEEDYVSIHQHKPYAHSIFKPNVKKPAFAVSLGVNVIRVMMFIVVLAGLACAGAVVGIAKGYMETAPTIDLAAIDNQNQTSFIYDANGKLITEYKGTENRVSVSLSAMPTYLRDAFIAVEDGRFYTHSGVDIKRIVGAFVSNMSSSSTQGGSTITQQLIKNTLLSSEQSYKRKIQEAYLALQLETIYTKDQILESYLNTIFLGENYYGVQVAAQGYFGKSLGELTLRECAMLAGTTNSPYYYNPRKNFYVRSKEGVDYPAITNNRTDYVLQCMYENQFITYEQLQEALDPATAHVLESDPSEGSGMYEYAHYVEYAVREVVDIFLQLEGLPDTAQNRATMETKLRTGGYRVKLAIDTDVQRTVEDTLQNWSKYPSLRDPADKVMRTKKSDGTYEEIVQPQAAAVVLDYRTGEIKAIVGSRTPVTQRKTLNRATDMKMPVGSSIKPIAVYAPALELGASPASIVYNMPLPIAGWKDANGKDIWPKNYGGGGYTGPVTMRKAMMNSLNTAAAYTLMNFVGVDRSVDFLHRMGVDDNHIDATPFGVTLGSSGITPMQMTVAYGVLANGGVYQQPISVLGISDSYGNVVWDGHANQQRRRVFSESTAWLICDMLKTAVKSGTGTAAKIKNQTVGGKTGTNSDQKGVFFAGMTGYYSSALWIGHDNYKALSSKSTGSGAAAPLWQSYMAKIHNGLANRDILEGDPSQYGLVKLTTCAVSGQLATDACYADTRYGTVTDYWAAASQPATYCQMHAMRYVCADSGQIASPYCPNVVPNSVVLIPPGHPLYQFITSQYASVLEEYLGSWATVMYDSQGNVVGGGSECAYHSAGGSVDSYVVDNTLIPDAQLLIGQAQSQLAGLDPAAPMYQSIQAAIGNLEAVIHTEGASQNDIAAAMGQLTRAMAGL